MVDIRMKWRSWKLRCRHEVKLWDWPVSDAVTCLGCNRTWWNNPQEESWRAGPSLLDRHLARILTDRGSTQP